MSCEDILNHPYLLPPRPSVTKVQIVKNLIHPKTKKKSLEKLPAAMEQNNFLSYQPSVAERYVDAMLSPIKSGCTSLDLMIYIFRPEGSIRMFKCTYCVSRKRSYGWESGRRKYIHPK